MMKRLLQWLVQYAEGALALWAHGFLGHLGLAREGTWGTAVAATDYAELMSENLSTTIDRFETRNIFAGFYEPDDFAGARRTAGGIVLAGNPMPMGHLLRAAMGTSSASTVLSGFLYTMNHTTVKSEFAAGVARPPYTLEVHRDVTSSHQYAGALLNRLTMAMAPNQDLRITAEWLAKARLLIAKTTPTFPGSPVDPFTFDTCSLQLAGAATARIEALTVVIDNQLEGILTLNNSNEIARVRATGPQLIRISGTMDFTDVTEEQDFINQTERVLKFTMTRANSFALLVEAPRFVYTAYPMGMPGRGRLTVGFEGRARYLVSSATALLAQLTVTKSNY